MRHIIQAKAFDDYKVWIKFSDGVEGTVDLSDLVGKGIFSRWLDKNYFMSVFVDPESHTIAWPDGIDLCPDELYAEITQKDIKSVLSDNTSNVPSRI